MTKVSKPFLLRKAMNKLGYGVSLVRLPDQRHVHAEVHMPSRSVIVFFDDPTPALKTHAFLKLKGFFWSVGRCETKKVSRNTWQVDVSIFKDLGSFAANVPHKVVSERVQVRTPRRSTKDEGDSGGKQKRGGASEPSSEGDAG